MSQAVLEQQFEPKLYDMLFARFNASLYKEKHPLNDSIQNISSLFHRFMSHFTRAPEDKKLTLAINPIFPSDIKFSDPEESRDSTRPLNYIMFTADHKALDVIEKYLQPEDWSRLGPYSSTFMHCIIAGIEKHSVHMGGEPIVCAQRLLKNFPKAKTLSNMLGESPKEYLQIVLSKLEENLKHIQKHGQKSFIGTYNFITLEDGTREDEKQYQNAIAVAKELGTLLT